MMGIACYHGNKAFQLMMSWIHAGQLLCLYVERLVGGWKQDTVT